MGKLQHSRFRQARGFPTRTVTGAKRGTSHSAIYADTGWPKLSDRRSNSKLKTFINITQNRAPPYPCSLLPPKVGDSRPCSRNTENYVPFKCRLEVYKNSFLPSAINLYNSISSNCRTLAHVNEKFVKCFFNYGERATNIICAQLRMKCSNLKSFISPSCRRFIKWCLRP